MLLNPFCPLTTANVLALKAAVIVLLTLLIKAKVRIKGQYETSLEQFDSAAEFVWAIGALFVLTVVELLQLPDGIAVLAAECSCAAMLRTYYGNLQRANAMAQQLQLVAPKARAIDVAEYCARLVAAFSKAC